MILKEKVVFITGASSGLGKALSLALSTHHCKLILVARSLSALKEVETACITNGAEAVVYCADVTIAEQCEKAVQFALQHFGKIDILINNAGQSMCSCLNDIKKISIFESLIQTNYLSSVYCTYYALPALKKSQGMVVGISSISGLVGAPTRTGYAAAKHAVQGFFDSLRIELAPFNVSVLTVAPGYIATGIRSRALNSDGEIFVNHPLEKEKEAISLEKCVAEIIDAIKKGKREIILPKKLFLARVLRVFFPSLLDKIAAKAVNFKG